MAKYTDVPEDDESIKEAALDLMSRWDDKWELLDHRILCSRIILNLLEERKGLRMLNEADAPLMTTPIGLLKVDSEGMRILADYCATLKQQINTLVSQDIPGKKVWAASTWKYSAHNE